MSDELGSASVPSTPAAATPAASTTTPATPSTVNTVGDASASLAFAESSLANPETPAVDTPTGAVDQSASATAPVSTTPDDDARSPFIPRARFDEVNARVKTAEEQLKQFDWAKDIPVESRDTLPKAWQLAQALDRDPVATIAALTEHAANNPQMAAALRSQMARLLAGGRQAQAQAAPTADPEPEPDLQAPDGTLVYSAAQNKVWQEWNTKQLTAKLTQQFQSQLQPFEQVAKTFQQREAHAAAVVTVTGDLAKFRAANPDVTDAHYTDIANTIAADQKLTTLADSDPALALEMAWNRVYRAKVLPEQQKKSEGQLLTNLQQRAVAATINPASASPTTPSSTIGNARAALMAAGVE